MVLVRFLFVFLLLACPIHGAGVEVPLTVRETAGIDRHQWPVRAGVPMPKGALKSVEKLQILDAQGRFVPALFAVANRWWEDGSIQWVHCDFAATVSANSQTAYVLREVVALPEFPSPMGFIPRGKAFEVITGPLRFVIGGESNQLLDEVWVDEGWGYNFNEQTKILDSGNFDLLLTSGSRVFRTAHWTQSRIEVEEHNALRSVVKILGSFALAGSKENRLDYIARLTTYGGKTYFKLELTLLNRREVEFPIDDLSLSFKLNLDLTQQKFILGGEPQDYAGNFENAPQTSLSLDSTGLYSVSGAVQGSGSGGSPRVGWVDLSDSEHGLSVAVKWFGLLYPKAFQVQNDSTLVVKLFTASQPGQALPAQSAKTHEMMLHFHGKRQLASGQVRNVMLGFQKPIYAVAPPAWYCSRTQALGRLLESSAGLLKPEFEGLTAKLDDWLTVSRRAVVAAREKPKEAGQKEPIGYGVFRFANPLPIATATDVKHADSVGAQGDFARALYLHFFRTGDFESLVVAEETLAAVADAGVIAEEPLQVGPMPSPILGSKLRAPEPYGVEGLMDAYLFTGNRRFLNAGRSLIVRMTKDGSAGVQNVASVANRSLALMKGYEATGDRRWLETSKALLETLYAWQDGDIEKLRRLAPSLAAQWQENFKEGFGKSPWEYGVVWNALRYYQRLSSDPSVGERMQRSAQWLYQNPNVWNAEKKEFIASARAGLVLAPGLASLFEETGNEQFLEQARAVFLKALETPLPIEDPGFFGSVFTAAQYFPWYLSKELQPGNKRDVSGLSRP